MKITRYSGTVIIIVLGCFLPFLCLAYFGSSAEIEGLLILGVLIISGFVLGFLYNILAKYIPVKPLFWVLFIGLCTFNIWAAYQGRERNMWKERYNISTKEFEKLYLKEDDSVLFKQLKHSLDIRFYPAIQETLAPTGEKGYYNLKGVRTNTVTDSVNEYTVDHIVFNKKGHMVIYLITYIGSAFANPNDSMKGGFVDDSKNAYTGVISATLDSNNNLIKFYVPEYTLDINSLNVKEQYESTHIYGSSPIIKDLRESIVKYFIVNYKYGSNTFWKDILVDWK